MQHSQNQRPLYSSQSYPGPSRGPSFSNQQPGFRPQPPPFPGPPGPQFQPGPGFSGPPGQFPPQQGFDPNMPPQYYSDRRGYDRGYDRGPPPPAHQQRPGRPPATNFRIHPEADTYRPSGRPGPLDNYRTGSMPQQASSDYSRHPPPNRSMPPRDDNRRPRAEDRRGREGDRRQPLPPREEDRGSPNKRPRLDDRQKLQDDMPSSNGSSLMARNASTDSEPPLYDREGRRSRSPSLSPRRRGRGRSSSRSPDRRRRRSRSLRGRSRSRSLESDRGGRYFDRRRRSRSRSRTPPRRRRTRSPTPEFIPPKRKPKTPAAAASGARELQEKGHNPMRKFFPGEELDDDDEPKKLVVDHPFLSPPRKLIQKTSDKGRPPPDRETIDVDAAPDPAPQSRSREVSHHSGPGTPLGPPPGQYRTPPGYPSQRTFSGSDAPPQNGHPQQQRRPDGSYPPPMSASFREDQRPSHYHQAPPGQFTNMPPRLAGPPPQQQNQPTRQLGMQQQRATPSQQTRPASAQQPTRSSSQVHVVPTTVTGSPAVPPPRGEEASLDAMAVDQPPAAPFEMTEASRTTEYYERIDQVGEGTYGKVYKAKSIEDGMLVALKMIRMDAEKDGFPVTAVREIKLLQSLRHENVVQLREMMVSRGHVHMVFEYVDHDLTGVLRHPSIKFTPAHLKSMMAQLLRGLEYIHRRGVLHRDLKGSNILVSRTGQLKIADFGLARFFAHDARNDYTNRVITQWYKPPELLFGATVYGPAVDIWSAGCIFLELFCGRPAFQGSDEIHQLDVIFRILGTPNDSWLEVSELPWYELVKPKKQQPNRLRDAYQKYIKTPATFSCAEALLTLNPDRRVTASEALKQPYFVDEEPQPEQPAFLDSVEGDWHEWEAKRRSRKKERGDAEE